MMLVNAQNIDGLSKTSFISIHVKLYHGIN